MLAVVYCESLELVLELSVDITSTSSFASLWFLHKQKKQQENILSEWPFERHSNSQENLPSIKWNGSCIRTLAHGHVQFARLHPGKLIL